MKKCFLIIISIIVLISIGFFIFKTPQNSNNYSSNYTAEKTSTFKVLTKMILKPLLNFPLNFLMIQKKDIPI